MMIGQSVQIRELLAELRRFASCDAPVLIEGETGTGKELAAREIHYSSPRAGRPFVPVNCGALSDSLIESELFGHCRGSFTDAKIDHAGLVEHACGGTLFLDEVDTLSAKAQVTLLRFLQDREYRPVGAVKMRAADVRVVAATNASLAELDKSGRFRSDLLYRLNPLYVRVPPLRERPGDVIELAEHFLQSASKQLATTRKRWRPSALSALRTYAWPGNVRELESVVLRACLHAEGTDVGLPELAAALPELATRVDAEAREHSPSGTFSAAKSRAIASFEHGYLIDLMRRAHGNVSEAARLSSVERRQLGKLLKKRGIERVHFGPE
ncbi:MAG TPA: sigma-54 dependent transcriptional regulator [Rudaea sp.]|jgi:DNA-binding NtrC family response regulator|uniref:sigma-54 dependent transcriptional regulator n=1 Tax=Rudaea sp. TaxID=2136325 RepID=UPI002F9290F7